MDRVRDRSACNTNRANNTYYTYYANTTCNTSNTGYSSRTGSSGSTNTGSTYTCGTYSSDSADQTPAGAIDAEVTENEDGSYELTPIEDTETPLANTDLDDHACCILHFLLMLLALLILILYTKSMNKRQARIFELREELELKKVRNGLGGEE